MTPLPPSTAARGLVVAQQSWATPGPYSAEVWFKTNSTRGGKLIGFGNATSGLSSSYDRHVYMQSGGKLSFGVATATASRASSPR